MTMGILKRRMTSSLGWRWRYSIFFCFLWPHVTCFLVFSFAFICPRATIKYYIPDWPIGVLFFAVTVASQVRGRAAWQFICGKNTTIWHENTVFLLLLVKQSAKKYHTLHKRSENAAQGVASLHGYCISINQTRDLYPCSAICSTILCMILAHVGVTNTSLMPVTPNCLSILRYILSRPPCTITK